MKKLSAVIINFNSGKYIFRCIQALFEQVDVIIEIIIIDNASSDGSEEMLKILDSQSKIKYIRLEKNIGASGANNLGISLATHDFILVLNADVFLENDYCKHLMPKFKDPNLGSCQGLLLSERCNDLVDSAGVKFYAEGIATDIGYGDPRTHSYDVDKYVQGVCCAAAIYRVSALKSCLIEGMVYDELYFAFFEDFELSYRLGIQGYRSKYVSSAIGYHVRGGSTHEVSDFVRFLSIRNLVFFNLSTWSTKTPKQKSLFILYIFLKLASTNLRIIRQVIKETYTKRIKILFRSNYYNSKTKVDLLFADSYLMMRIKKLFFSNRN